VADIDAAAAESTSRECKAVASNPGFTSQSLAVDVTSLHEVEAAVQQAAAALGGRIDYCVNCAGVSTAILDPLRWDPRPPANPIIF
jgi:NAD(P)-dependent dehydrogenase (short-subunit alcohol dehydrogenase family)